MISAKDLWDQIDNDFRNASGIYKLHCLLVSGTYMPVRRLLGEDKNGVLYIGSSACIRHRVAQLRKALSAAAGRDGFVAPGVHPCGHKYKAPNIQKLLPFERLCITVYPTANPGDDLGALEANHLNIYEIEFGEAPPFNEGRPKAKWLCANQGMQAEARGESGDAI